MGAIPNGWKGGVHHHHGHERHEYAQRTADAHANLGDTEKCQADNRDPEKDFHCVEDGVCPEASPPLEALDVLGKQLVRKDNDRLETLEANDLLAFCHVSGGMRAGLADHGDCHDIHPVHGHVVRSCDNFPDGESDDDGNQDKLEDVNFRLELRVEPTTLEEGLGTHLLADVRSSRDTPLMSCARRVELVGRGRGVGRNRSNEN